MDILYIHPTISAYLSYFLSIKHLAQNEYSMSLAAAKYEYFSNCILYI